MSEKTEDAKLILKLYDLRREETMRKARDWFAREFNPESTQDFVSAIMDERNGAYYRMVTSYWEMAASFVNNGAVDEQMFNDANGEHILVYAKLEPYMAELREMFHSPHAYAHLEKLVTRMPNVNERLAALRERMKSWADTARKKSAATEEQSNYATYKNY